MDSGVNHDCDFSTLKDYREVFGGRPQGKQPRYLDKFVTTEKYPRGGRVTATRISDTGSMIELFLDDGVFEGFWVNQDDVLTCQEVPENEKSSNFTEFSRSKVGDLSSTCEKPRLNYRVVVSKFNPLFNFLFVLENQEVFRKFISIMGDSENEQSLVAIFFEEVEKISILEDWEHNAERRIKFSKKVLQFSQELDHLSNSVRRMVSSYKDRWYKSVSPHGDDSRENYSLTDGSKLFQSRGVQ